MCPRRNPDQSGEEDLGVAHRTEVHPLPQEPAFSAEI